MASTDSIVIPVELGNLDVRKLLDQLGPQLKTKMAEVARGMLSNEILNIPTTVVSKEQFQAGGKTFEATTRHKIKSVERSVGEHGEEDIVVLDQLAVSVKEVRQKLSDQITADAKRFSEFKKSIRFQPLEIKQEAIRGFLGEFASLEKSIQGKLPIEQLREIRQFVDKASTFKPSVKQQFQTEISKFEQSIQDLSSDEQQRAIKEFVKRFGDQNNELKFRLDGIIAKLRRKQFRKIELENIDLPIEKRIQAYQDYADSGKEFAKEARAKVEKLKNVLGRQQIHKLKTEAFELRGDERLKFIQQAIDKGNVPIREADKFLQQEREKFQRQTQKQLKVKLSVLKTEDRIKLLEQVLTKTNEPINELNRLLEQEKQKQSALKIQGKPKSLKVESRIKFFEGIIASSNHSVDEIQSLLDRDREKLIKQKDRRLTTKLKSLKIEDRSDAIQQALKNGDINTERANQLIDRTTESLKRQNLKRLKLDIVPLKDFDVIRLIEQRIAEGNLPIQEANNLLQKQKETLSKKLFTRFKTELKTLEVEDRIPLLERAIAAGNHPVEELNILLKKDKENLLKKTTRQFRLKLVDLKIEERQKAIQDAFNRGEIDKEELNRQMKKETDRFKRQQVRKVRQKISIQLPEEAIASIRQAVADGLLLLDEANVLIAKQSKKFVDSIAKSRRQGFTGFTRHLQTIDPNIAIKILNDYIDKRGSVFAEEAKIVRQRLQKQIQSAQQQSQRDRSRNFANNVLIGAGAGLGLLGAAGFPLLNIGFAAMSGGPVGAGIAALATGLGEGTRAINRFRQSTISAATELGLVSKQSKIAEARMKAFDAIIGQASMSSQRVGSEIRFDLLKDSVVELRSVMRLFTDSVESLKTTFTKAVIGARRPGATGLEGPGTNFILDFLEQRKKSQEALLPDLLDARLQFIKQMNRTTVGIENSPFESWKRIQQSAFDTTKQDEMEMLQKQLDALNKMIKLAEEALREKTWLERLPLLGTF